MSDTARLPLWEAAFVIARRDFTAIVFSKVFLLFLIGPLFFLGISAGGGLIGAMAADCLPLSTVCHQTCSHRRRGMWARELGPP